MSTSNSTIEKSDVSKDNLMSSVLIPTKLELRGTRSDVNLTSKYRISNLGLPDAYTFVEIICG